MNGLILIDKPSGMTSHDIVNRCRKLANTKRVGHLGTLDPMATGLLCLVLGPATRLAQFFGKAVKTYLAEITLGFVSDSYDAEGEIRPTGEALPTAERIAGELNHFRGRILQTPPAVSAKKIAGVPAYKLARKKVAVALQPVEVEIYQLQVERLTADKITILVTTSAGTYIRSIAHDLGQRLGCGAILSALRRTHAGDYSVAHARTLEQLAELASQGRLDDAIIPAAQLLPHMPVEHVNSLVEAQIRQGRDFRTSPFVVSSGAPFVKAVSFTGELIAIGELKIPNLYHPATVF